VSWWSVRFRTPAVRETGHRPRGVFLNMNTRIGAVAPLLIILVSLIVAACNNGAGGNGY
jgi:predicted small secreted protein